MEAVEEFPFGTGQLVESKSNIKGFRGAWFRSEIKCIQIRKGEIWCAMHYMDFPDEKNNYMKAYQHDVSGKKKRVLMVRPLYPLVLTSNDESAISAAPGSVVVVNGDWWVGDLVDWFTDGCFWAAKITAILTKDTVKVELPSAPLGEGGCYEAAVKDIRPSLDWSVADQYWTVPGVQSCSNIHKTDDPSGSLSNPGNPLGIPDKDHIFIAKQEPARTKNFISTLTGREEVQLKRKFSVSLPDRTKLSDVRLSNTSLKAPEPFSARAGKASPMHMVGKQSLEASFHRNQEPAHHVERDGCTELQGLASQIDATGNAISATHVVGSSNAPNDGGEAALFEEFNTLLGEGECLDVSDERISSSIVALEELVSRVAWLKGVVQFGMKGWSKEVRKRKWILTERDDLPVDSKSQQDAILTQNLGPGAGNSLRQAQVGGSCVFAFHEVVCKTEPL